MRIDGKFIALAPALLLLAACGSGAGSGAGDVTPDENRALNDAAAMLDANSVDTNAVTPEEANEEQPQ